MVIVFEGQGKNSFAKHEKGTDNWSVEFADSEVCQRTAAIHAVSI